MTRTRRALAIRFLLYALSFSLFIFVWWDCATIALVNIWAKPVAGRVTGTKVETSRTKQGFERQFYIFNFRFVVNGAEYSGNNFTCCDAMLTGSGIDAAIRKKNDEMNRSKAQQVTVWVNPAMPQHAVLSRDVPNAAICVFIFTLMLSYGLSKLIVYRLETGAWPEKFEKI